MNKWFIIYCVLNTIGLTKHTIDVAKTTKNELQDWTIVFVAMLLAVFKIGLVYLAVREGF